MGKTKGKKRNGWTKEAWLAYKKAALFWVNNMMHAVSSNQAAELMNDRRD